MYFAAEDGCVPLTPDASPSHPIQIPLIKWIQPAYLQIRNKYKFRKNQSFEVYIIIITIITIMLRTVANFGSHIMILITFMTCHDLPPLQEVQQVDLEQWQSLGATFPWPAVGFLSPPWSILLSGFAW